MTDLSPGNSEGREIPNNDRVHHSTCFIDPEDCNEPSGIEMLKRRTSKGECDESTSRRPLRCVAFMGGNMNMRRPYDGDAFSKVRPETSDAITRTRPIASDPKLCFPLGANFVTPM